MTISTGGTAAAALAGWGAARAVAQAFRGSAFCSSAFGGSAFAGWPGLAWRAAAHLQADDDVVPAGPEAVQDERVTELLSLVDGVERLILQCRFGLGEAPPQSYAGVAEVVGLSEATVRRRERAALERLRRVA